MNKDGNLLILIVLTFLGYSTFATSKAFLDQGKFLTANEAKKRWGQKPFAAQAFKDGSAKDRAPMVYDLILKREFVGKTASEVKAQLGPTSGYFWSERVPTYLIEERWAEKKDTWQLVFLIDEKERVKKVRIHKNCCE